MLAAPQIARNLPFLALTGLLVAVGCNAEGDSFDDNFSEAANGGAGVTGQADAALAPGGSGPSSVADADRRSKSARKLAGVM